MCRPCERHASLPDIRMLWGVWLEISTNEGLTAAMSILYSAASASRRDKTITFTFKLHSFDIQMQIYIKMWHILFTADLILSTLTCTTGRGSEECNYSRCQPRFNLGVSVLIMSAIVFISLWWDSLVTLASLCIRGKKSFLINVMWY